MEHLIKFTPEEFKEYQTLLEKGRAYDKVVKQRDEAAAKLRKLEDAIEDAGFGVTISSNCDGKIPDFSIHEMDDELKAYYKEYPHSGGHIRPYQD